MRLSVPSVPASLVAGWLKAAFHSGLGSLLLSPPQALSSFMRAIDAQSAIVQKARYSADMEQP